jgi:hypothetical protein
MDGGEGGVGGRGVGGGATIQAAPGRNQNHRQYGIPPPPSRQAKPNPDISHPVSYEKPDPSFSDFCLNMWDFHLCECVMRASYGHYMFVSLLTTYCILYIILYCKLSTLRVHHIFYEEVKNAECIVKDI